MRGKFVPWGGQCVLVGVTNTPCPVCLSPTAAKFDRRSDWCVECVEGELEDQRAEDTHVVAPEII